MFARQCLLDYFKGSLNRRQNVSVPLPNLPSRVYISRRRRNTHRNTTQQTQRLKQKKPDRFSDRLLVTMNAIKEAMQNCKNAIMSRKSSFDKFAKTVDTPVTRAGPTKTSKDDAKNGVGSDYGETFQASNGKTYQNINLQLNKGAEYPTLARLERE